MNPGRKLVVIALAVLKSMLHRQHREAKWTCAAQTRRKGHERTLGKISHVFADAIVKPIILAQNTRLNDGRRPARNLRVFPIAFIGVSFVAWGTMAQGLDSSPNGFRNSTELHGSNEFTRSNDPNELSRSNDSHHVNRYSSTSKPCIALESFVTIQPINKNIYEHWITASNSCGQNIRIQVCYHKTDDCIVMNVPPYDNKNAVLGIQPSVKEFEYDAKEK